MAEESIAALRSRLEKYPPGRYPVQHATGRFHLGMQLLHDGAPDAAAEAFAAAAALFTGAGLAVEQAKARNMYGAARRAAGALEEAGRAFRDAAHRFELAGEPAQAAGARYNEGLVLCEQDRHPEAQQAFTRAFEVFSAETREREAAGAARELGCCLLVTGSVPEAREWLVRAQDLAGRAQDLGGLGTSANALGLACLADGDAAAAVTAFRAATGAFPRSLRPEEHAMAKANLALAYERVGQAAPARLAARQALAVAGAGEVVRDQAQAIVHRLTTSDGDDLLAVLDALGDPDECRPVLREEMLRWAAAGRPERLRCAGAFLAGMVSRPAQSYNWAELLLSVLLEVAPADYATLTETIVLAAEGLPGSERVQAVLSSGLARFPLPQWQRLAATFSAVSAAAGEHRSWA